MRKLKFVKTIFVALLLLLGLYQVKAFGDCKNLPMVHIDKLGDVCGRFIEVTLDNGTQKKIREFHLLWRRG